MKQNLPQNYINHIALVLDSSSSMSPHVSELIKVADNQIAYLAQRSKELDQETRITVYSFADTAQCLVYDKDVLRMPSIKQLYQAHGNTALVDAAILALDDLALTPEKYGEHAFLIYVLTDGEENRSRQSPSTLSSKINNLPDHWTLAAFVPNQNGVFETKKFGFPKENISVWDATTVKGVSEAGEKIRQTTETFMQNRKLGIRGSKNLFTLQPASVQKVVNSSTLNKLHSGQFRMLDVDATGRIDEFIEGKLHRPYSLGEAYYQLMKPETIQASKRVAIWHKNYVYTGKEARDLIGLPDYDIKVKPADYPGYEIFIQSTSLNRKLIEGTRVLVLS